MTLWLLYKEKQNRNWEGNGNEVGIHPVESHWICASLLIIANTITLIFDVGMKHEDCTGKECFMGV